MPNTGVGKSGFKVMSTRNTEFILILLFIYLLLYYLFVLFFFLLLLLLLFRILTYYLSFR
jgi:hypothetical protein